MKFSRSSGVLLHPTSLPGPFGIGDLGPVAYHFIDWLVVAGQKLWQMLPVTPVGMGNSPYMSLSAFAGSPLLIDLGEFVQRGWLKKGELDSPPSFPADRVDYEGVSSFRTAKLMAAMDGFCARASSEERAQFESFCNSNAGWLDDYSLFMASYDKNGGRVWNEWDNDIVRRKPAALKKARNELRSQVEVHKFVQWCFFRQWNHVKKYANERGVQLVGDIPIFVAHNSSDVWSHPDAFYLDGHMKPEIVAGVPPDYFSKTGQRWGNPLYRWDVMKAGRYSWWVERFRMALRLFDIVRIDHFRGFAAYWEIPATEKTAEKGTWVDGPKEDLFNTVEKALGKLPIIAEDLGLITPDVIELRDKFQFPGMKILQFAFAGGANHPFLPHCYPGNCVVYTGTHDNDTTRGWFQSATERERSFARKYASTDGREIHWDLIRLASQSVADISVVPFQDALGLGTEGRMNYPGTSTGNWEWRFGWHQVLPEHALRLYDITALYGRCPADRLSLPAYPGGKPLP